MPPKNTYFTNISFSKQILILFLLIFSNTLTNTLTKAQTVGIPVQTNLFSNLLLQKLFTLCPAISLVKTTNFLLASDNSTKLLVYYTDGLIESINFSTRSVIWRAELGGKIISQMLSDPSEGKTVYVVTEIKSSVVWAINAETGITKWQLPVSFPTAFSEATGEKAFLHFYQNILIVVYQNGKVLSLDKDTGVIRWVKSIDSDVTSVPSFVEDQVFLSGSGNVIILINLVSGSITNRIRTPVAPGILLPLNKTNFIWSDKTGKVFFNEKLKFRAGAEISNLSFTSQGILITSKDNFLYMISKVKQKILWKKKLAGRIFPKPLVIDRWAIVTVLGESYFSVIDLNNGLIINTLTIDNGNYFVGEFFNSSTFLFIPTVKGLYFFASAGAKCV